ncbi:primase 1D-like protein [Aeromonas caviae]|uniref:primase 1D-like protein n=1 Tax=Aeromonas caviae TaxID=648 RepID=UPI003F747735
MGVNRVSYRRHPCRIYIEHLLDLRQVRRSVKTIISFKRYIYTPSTIRDENIHFVEAIDNIDMHWLDNYLSRLDFDEELAINSTITIDGIDYFIPMIDLSTSELTTDNIRVLDEFMNYWDMDFFVFDSGRSFHLYGTELLRSNETWTKFMGSLLLLNKRGGKTLIDTRWVGHRILAGESSLRWSNNSLHYKRYPIFHSMMREFIRGYKTRRQSPSLGW